MGVELENGNSLLFPFFSLDFIKKNRILSKQKAAFSLDSIFEFIMEFSPRAAELTTLLESRITNFYTNLKVDEIGRVVSVGDGIARVYGLNEIQAGEMVEFASGVKGIALNLENENWGVFLYKFLSLKVLRQNISPKGGRGA